MKPRMVAVAVFVVTIVLMLSGCGRSPSPMYYTLEASNTGTAQSVELPESFTLGLRQVSLPSVLKQPQLVLINNEQVKPLEFHRWSEPLDAAILRVVSTELRSRLNTASILSYPWPAAFDPAQTLTINVTHFSGLPGEEVELAGVWILSNMGGSPALITERFHFIEKVVGTDYPALVRAHSGALDQFVNQLAVTLIAVD